MISVYSKLITNGWRFPCRHPCVVNLLTQMLKTSIKKEIKRHDNRHYLINFGDARAKMENTNHVSNKTNGKRMLEKLFNFLNKKSDVPFFRARFSFRHVSLCLFSFQAKAEVCLKHFSKLHCFDLWLWHGDCALSEISKITLSAESKNFVEKNLYKNDDDNIFRNNRKILLKHNYLTWNSNAELVEWFCWSKHEQSDWHLLTAVAMHHGGIMSLYIQPSPPLPPNKCGRLLFKYLTTTHAHPHAHTYTSALTRCSPYDKENFWNNRKSMKRTLIDVTAPQ